MVGKKVLKLRSIAELRAFYGSHGDESVDAVVFCVIRKFKVNNTTGF